MDFAGLYDDPVLAAADGRVWRIYTGEMRGIIDESLCGLGVLILHANLGGKYTVYCHFSSVSVKTLEDVKRGQEIGRVGTSGNSMGIPHVHLSLCEVPCYGTYAVDHVHLDPLAVSAGCFDPNKAYPPDRLTYPVKCRD